MQTAEERKEYLTKISEKKKEIIQLKTELNSINDKKEKFFKKKEEISKKISGLIKDIKQSRVKRDLFTKQVRKDKEERNLHNKEVRSAVTRIKDFEKERDDLLRKHNIKDPTYILKQISDLDMKIETEPMSFDKEKKLMVKIKQLKKKVEEAKSVGGIVDKIHKLSQEIDRKKGVAQDSHKQVQSHAKKSQERHEFLLDASSDLDDLKKEEEEAFKNFVDHKKKFNDANENLKKLLIEIKQLSEKVSKDSKKHRYLSEQKKKATLEQKKISVEEKLKKGMKLTTEDILAFQGMNND